MRPLSHKMLLFSPQPPLQPLSGKRKGVGKKRRPGATSFLLVLLPHLNKCSLLAAGTYGVLMASKNKKLSMHGHKKTI
jgi:hypothetical protein